ncbi:MAG TPA: hypothetical protein VID24_09035 [Candidatus Eremiobacteraceae bacterium]|jgi:hypothetical protein
MRIERNATVTVLNETRDVLNGSRTELVRIPAGADTTLFGGWGVRI